MILLVLISNILPLVNEIFCVVLFVVCFKETCSRIFQMCGGWERRERLCPAAVEMRGDAQLAGRGKIWVSPKLLLSYLLASFSAFPPHSGPGPGASPLEQASH